MPTEVPAVVEPRGFFAGLSVCCVMQQRCNCVMLQHFLELKQERFLQVSFVVTCEERQLKLASRQDS